MVLALRRPDNADLDWRAGRHGSAADAGVMRAHIRVHCWQASRARPRQPAERTAPTYALVRSESVVAGL